MALPITAASSETKGTVCLTPRDFLWSLLCVQCFISTLIEPIYISSPYPAAQVTWIRTWALNLIISLPWSPISLQTLRLNFPAHHESNQNTGKTFFFFLSLNERLSISSSFLLKSADNCFSNPLNLKQDEGKNGITDLIYQKLNIKLDTEGFYFTEAPPETTFEVVLLKFFLLLINYLL